MKVEALEWEFRYKESSSNPGVWAGRGPGSLKGSGANSQK